MSKESIRRSIEIKKAEIARHRTSIASLRSRKSETNTRYSANIKNASGASAKASLRTQKASAVAYIESQIRSELSTIAGIQRNIVSLREQLKNAR